MAGAGTRRPILAAAISDTPITKQAKGKFQIDALGGRCPPKPRHTADRQTPRRRAAPADRGARRRGVFGLYWVCLRGLPAHAGQQRAQVVKNVVGQHGKLAFAGRAAVGGGPVQPDAAGGRVGGASPWASSAAIMPARISPLPPRARPGLPVPLCKKPAVRCGDHGAAALQHQHAAVPGGVPCGDARPVGLHLGHRQGRSGGPSRRGGASALCFRVGRRGGTAPAASAFSASASSTQAFQAKLPPSSACSTAPAPAPSPGPPAAPPGRGQTARPPPCTSPGQQAAVRAGAAGQHAAFGAAGQRQLHGLRHRGQKHQPRAGAQRALGRQHRRAQVAPAAGKGRHRA